MRCRIAVVVFSIASLAGCSLGPKQDDPLGGTVADDAGGEGGTLSDTDGGRSAEDSSVGGEDTGVQAPPMDDCVGDGGSGEAGSDASHADGGMECGDDASADAPDGD